ncbi:MAG: hypothetical protein HDR88_07055 [Bacteroides sp.]|nr:hypothetical protein [Bacteroides sp.]
MNMNKETTRLINEPPKGTPAAKESNKKYTAAATGFVAGVASGAAVAVAATNQANAEDSTHPEMSVESPAPEKIILANDEGIRYAHVDAVNFNEAFAQARQQVGPGGVFEYDGRLYGTYYADEWNQMTAQERADYQSRVNEVAPSHHATSSSTNYADNSVQHHIQEPASQVVPTDMEMIAAEPVDNEIRVLGVETVQNGNGQIMNVALIESEGDHALLVDVDNNGMIDVLLHDDDHDGYIQESEVYDISGAGIEVADLMQSQAATESDALYTSMDDMPDPTNDADNLMII